MDIANAAGPLSSVIGLFGGAAFRAIWAGVGGLISSWVEHKQEIQKAELQDRLDANKHQRNLTEMETAKRLELQVIERKGEIDLSLLDGEIFKSGLENLGKPSGFWIIDAWKSSIQPALATLVLWMVFQHYYTLNFKLDDRGWELCGAVIGMYVADRFLFRRGQ